MFFSPSTTGSDPPTASDVFRISITHDVVKYITCVVPTYVGQVQYKVGEGYAMSEPGRQLDRGHDDPGDDTIVPDFDAPPRANAGASAPKKTLAPTHEEDTIVPDSLGGSAVSGETGSHNASWYDIPESVGPYRILRSLGRGGMGRVFLAQQEKPKREVALKLLAHNTFTAEFMARFEGEYHTLARMESEHIARIYDVGTSEKGDPFFTMEYVNGSPIIQFCCDQNLPLKQRLAVFLQVCTGVLHAHQRAVVHRDLKPSNILVAKGEKGPIVKIIDFGIAKSLSNNQRIEERRFETQVGAVLGTPAYTSPEQLGQAGMPIDTRTDIYALGVVLYELTTNLTPFEEKRFTDTSWDEMLRIYREEEPPLPSMRLLKHHGRNRAGKQLAHKLKGDMDRVIMKAISKDIKSRYASVGALIADIQAFLNGLPVSVGPPNPLYRLGKYAIRYRVPVMVLTLTLLGLAAGLALTLWSREQVREQRNKADYLSNFLWDLLETPDPRNVGPNARVMDLVDQAVTQLNRADLEAMGLAMEVRERLGRTYTGLGSYDKALTLLQQAYNNQLLTLGRDHKRTLDTQYDLAVATVKNHYAAEEAPTQYQRALAIFQDCAQRRTRILGENARKTLQTQSYIAFTYSRLREKEKALEAYQAVLAAQVRAFGEDDEDALVSLSGVAMAFKDLGDLQGAVIQFSRLIPKLQRKMGDDDPRTLAAMSSLAACFRSLNQLDNAYDLYEKVGNTRQQRLGPDHPSTLSTRYYQAEAACALRRYHLAEPILNDLLTRRLKRRAPCDRLVLSSVKMYGRSLRGTGKLAQATALLEEYVNLCREQESPPLILADLTSNLGDYYLKLKQYQRAAAIMEEAVHLQDTLRGKDSQGAYIAHITLAEAYSRYGLKNKAIAQWKAVFQNEAHPAYRSAAAKIAANLHKEMLPVPATSTFESYLP